MSTGRVMVTVYAGFGFELMGNAVDVSTGTPSDESTQPAYVRVSHCAVPKAVPIATQGRLRRLHSAMLQ